MASRLDAAATWEAIDSLTPWDRNPRRNDHAVKTVADSIRRFGFGSPIIARTADRVIIGGHTRWKAAQLLGMDKVPVRFLDLDPAEAAALALADNKLAELAEWDDEAVADILGELERQGTPIDGLGWDDDELRELLGDGIEAAPPSDDAPELDEDGEPNSTAGTVYQLGPHRLVCGDCRDADMVSRLMDGRRINLAFTSPPYASQRKYDETSGFKPIPPDDYVAWFDAVQANVRAHLAADGSWFVNIKEHTESGQKHLYVLDLCITHVRGWSWRLIDQLVWRRGGMPGLFGPRFKNEWEPIFHFSASEDVRFRPDNVREDRESSGEFRPDKLSIRQGKTTRGIMKHYDSVLPGNVIECAMGSNAGSGHSAAFPLALPQFFVKAYSDDGDAVYDPFMGSGTTLMAAAAEGRIAYGCEISPRYCDLIRRRWTMWAVQNGIDPGPGALHPREVSDGN
jgi:hypothetical protein